MKIYVGNLDVQVKEDEIRDLFAAFGEVTKVTILRDRNGISKGFGFVEMPSKEAADSAVEGLNRTLFYGRTFDVRQSSPLTGKGGQERAKSRHIRFRR